MLKVYGSMLCPDCVQIRKDLDNAAVQYEYLDFSDSLIYLKEFLALRELPLFDPVKEKGTIGIPCIVDEEGNVSLSWEKYVSQAEPDCQ